MDRGKKQPQEQINYDAIVFSLLTAAYRIVRDASLTLGNQLPPEHQPKLQKVEDELFYFLVFAIDYWWQTDIARTQEQKRCFGETWSSHLGIWFGDDPKGQAITELNERLAAYGEIVNEKNDDAVKLFRFTTAFSDYCNIPFPLTSFIVPNLFLTAMESVYELGKR